MKVPVLAKDLSPSLVGMVNSTMAMRYPEQVHHCLLANDHFQLHLSSMNKN